MSQAHSNVHTRRPQTLPVIWNFGLHLMGNFNPLELSPNAATSSEGVCHQENFTDQYAISNCTQIPYSDGTSWVGVKVTRNLRRISNQPGWPCMRKRHGPRDRGFLSATCSISYKGRRFPCVEDQPHGSLHKKPLILVIICPIIRRKELSDHMCAHARRTVNFRLGPPPIDRLGCALLAKVTCMGAGCGFSVVR